MQYTLSKMPVVALFVRSLRTGGAEHVAARLSKIWSCLGYRVVIVSATPLSGNDYQYAAESVEIADFSSLNGKRLGELNNKYAFDIVVFNSCWDYAWFETALNEFKGSGAKIVYIMHHSFANWMFMLVCLKELMDSERWLKSIDAFVCVDKLSALWWQEAGAKSIYIPNPVDDEKDGHYTHEYSKRIAWVGRVLDSGKRIELMLKVFQKIKSIVPDSELFVFGQSSKGVEKRLLKAMPGNFWKSIHFMGFSPNITDMVSRCGIHAFTSLVEASPQVIPEAQSCGLPTVAFDLPVLCDYDTACGVIKVKDEKSFCDECIRLLTDRFAQLEISEAAHRAAKNRASENVCQEVWSGLFRTIGNSSALAEFLKKNRLLFDNDRIKHDVFCEMRRASAYMSVAFVPDLLWLRKWRRRLNLGFLLRRMLGKIGIKE